MSSELAEADWRGVASEDAEITPAGNSALARRSRRLLLDLVAPYRRQAWLALAIIVIDNVGMVAGPLIIAYALDFGVPAVLRGDWLPLAVAAVGYGANAGLIAITALTFLTVSGRLSQNVLFDLRQRLFVHAQRLSVSFHERYTSGKIVARMTSDVEKLEELLERALNDALGAVLSVVTVAALLIWLDWPLALIVFAGFIPLALVTRWAQRRQRTAYRRTRGAMANVVVHLVEAMGGIRAVQTFRREARNKQILESEDRGYARAGTDGQDVLATYTAVMYLVGNLTTAAVVLFGGWRVIHGDTEIGILAAFVLYLGQFYGPLDELAQTFSSYQSAAAALERISGVLDERPTVAEPARPVALSLVRGELRAEGVSFGYSAEKVVLQKFSLDIPAGQVVALVGATGAGKSTLAKLFTRFYDPLTGSVRLDGVSLSDVSDADLRRNVVMVTQEAYLFAGSVADNIRLGRPSATDEEVEAAARAVGLFGYIDSLPHRFATDVRKRGGRLSAGQRQLVAFARVFLAAPAVIVLDEATASLDIPSERLVQRALEVVLAGRTAIIIAHRLSTVEIADRVLVMDGGRIVEDGTPAALLASAGRFAALHSAWRESLRG